MFTAETAGSLVYSPGHLLLLGQFQEMYINIFQETARTTELHLSIFKPALGKGQIAMLFGTCNRHIKQASLLFQFLIRIE